MISSYIVICLMYSSVLISDRPKIGQDYLLACVKNDQIIIAISAVSVTNEPPRGKTNNVVSEQVRHKPTCTSTEKS